jgi:hypothetical protein
VCRDLIDAAAHRDFSIFVLRYCELRAQKQAQLKIGPFEPQPGGYQN